MIRRRENDARSGIRNLDWEIGALFSREDGGQTPHLKVFAHEDGIPMMTASRVLRHARRVVATMREAGPRLMK
jgi:hypothetical protein